MTCTTCIRLGTLLIVTLALLSPSQAQSVVGWRSDGTGVFPDTTPPTHWSTTQNVRWFTELPGRSNAQPIVVGDRIFVCAEPFRLMCLNRQDGRVIWERDHAYESFLGEDEWRRIQAKLEKGDRQRKLLEALEARLDELSDAEGAETENAIASIERDRQEVAKDLEQLSDVERYRLPTLEQPHNGYTTATPVSDGRHVWVVFGHRVVACYDLDGNRKWLEVLDENPHAMWGHSSSPVLADGKLIVNLESTMALDAATGEQIWRTKYGQSWGSPTVARIGGQSVVLLANGRILSVEDGRVLCRVAQLAYSSPFVQGGVAYYVGVQATAYRLPEDLSDPFEPEQLWSVPLKGGQFYASSILHAGRLYAVSTRHILNILDAWTGESLSVERLKLGDEPTWTSLALAGGHLFVTSRDGTTIVLALDDDVRVVARNELEPLISNALFHDNELYMRTYSGLYCLERK